MGIYGSMHTTTAADMIVWGVRFKATELSGYIPLAHTWALSLLISDEIGNRLRRTTTTSRQALYADHGTSQSDPDDQDL